MEAIEQHGRSALLLGFHVPSPARGGSLNDSLHPVSEAGADVIFPQLAGGQRICRILPSLLLATPGSS